MSIHPQILSDTLEVCSTTYSHVRLMNDSRWPWLILLPQQANINELHDLTHKQRDLFMADVNHASRVMQVHSQCRSVNIAMLGNVVSQLHCHVVARDEGDPNWPRPVWGFESAVPYDDSYPEALIRTLRKSFA